MAGFTASLKESLRTLTGWPKPKPSSSPSAPPPNEPSPAPPRQTASVGQPSSTPFRAGKSFTSSSIPATAAEPTGMGFPLLDPESLELLPTATAFAKLPVSTTPILLPPPSPEPAATAADLPEEILPMSTPPTAQPAAAQPNVFVRFIDAIGAFFRKAAPALKDIETLAVEAEPILALTPAGPEYQVAVNAIVGAQQVAAASIAAGGPSLSNTQKAAIAVSAATPALNTILTSKGVTAGTETVIATWIQNVFNILAGPVASLVEGSSGASSASAGTEPGA